MVLNKPDLADRLNEEITSIWFECQAEGRDLTERFALELQQARRALELAQQHQERQQDGPWDYVVELHTARVAAFEQELLKHAEPLKA